MEAQTERQFQLKVEQLCKWMGLPYYHTHNSQHSSPGFPDMVIVGDRKVLFRELKTDKGKTSPMQDFWLQILRDAGEDTGVWRPSDWVTVMAELKSLGGKPRTPVPAKKSARAALKPFDVQVIQPD